MDDTLAQALVALLQQSPITALLLWMWWQERKERLVGQAKLDKYLMPPPDNPQET